MVRAVSGLGSHLAVVPVSVRDHETLWTRFQSGTMKLKYFKFWGDVPEAQRKDNLRGFGMTAALLVINVLLNIF